MVRTYQNAIELLTEELKHESRFIVGIELATDETRPSYVEIVAHPKITEYDIDKVEEDPISGVIPICDVAFTGYVELFSPDALSGFRVVVEHHEKSASFQL